MTIARTMSNLREAKKALKVAQSKIDLLDEQVDNILESVPHTLKDILADFDNFCNNSQYVIDEDFEDIRDPSEVREDIVNAFKEADLRFNQDVDDTFSAMMKCKAYLAVRDRWMVEICDELVEKR